MPHRTRFRAFAIHLGVSLLIFTGCVLLLRGLWFPEPHFTANGGWQGLQLVALVDVVLGPLITLVIFNPEKPRRELFVDMSLIASLQIAALVWGLSTVYSQRPLALTFWEDRFYSVSAEHFPANDIPISQLRQYGETFPVLIHVRPPRTGEEQRRFIEKTLGQNIPANLMPELYQPLAENFARIRVHSLPIEPIARQNPEVGEQLQAFLKKTQGRASDYFYLPLETGFQDMLMIFDHEGRLQGYLTGVDLSRIMSEKS